MSVGFSNAKVMTMMLGVFPGVARVILFVSRELLGGCNGVTTTANF